MKVTIGMVVVSALLAADVCLAGEFELVNERRVFAEKEPIWKTSSRNYLWAMRLSPGAKHLLYPRAKGEPPKTPEGGPDWHKVQFEMMLRDLGTGKESVLPIPPLDSGWRTVFTRFNVFDPSGGKLCLASIELHKERVGEHAVAVRPSMKLVLYDIPTGKLTSTPLEGPNCIAKLSASFGPSQT